MNKQLESRITTMKHRLEAGGKAIKDHARHARTRGARLIRREPYTSLTVATLAGVALGALLAYRPRNSR